MRLILLSVFVLLSQPGSAASTIACGFNYAQLPLVAANNLEHRSDTYPITHCSFEPSHHPGRNEWFPALPALRWQRSYPTRLSRSANNTKYQHWFVQLPIARFQQHRLNAEIHHSYQQLEDTFSRSTFWPTSNQNFATGQSVIAEKSTDILALKLKIFRPPAGLNYVSIINSRITQPMFVEQQLPAPSAFMVPAELSSYSVETGLEHNRSGWNIPWSMTLGQGKIDDNGTQFIRQTGVKPQFNLVGLQITLTYRWRWSRSWQFVAGYQVNWQYFDFPDALENDRYKLSDSSTLTQQFRSQLEWRF